MVDLPRSVWIAAIAAFVAVGLGTASLILVWEWFRERSRRSALTGQLRSLAEQVGADAAGAQTILRAAVADSPTLQMLVTRLPQLRDAEFMLAQAGMTWTLQTLLLLTFGFGFGFGAAALILSRSFLIAAAAAAFGAFLPYMYVRRRRTKRYAAFEEQLPDTIDLVGRALRAGHPLTAGIKMAADDSSDPIAGELRRVFEEQRFGLPLQDSLLALCDRVALIDIRILVAAILIQREVGGNLAEILDNLAEVMRARFTIRRQIRVYTAQGRMTGYVVGFLPIILGVLLYMLNPEYESILFTDKVGRALVVVGLALQFMGFLWIRKIVNIEI
jgi:tight adherence protein B